MNKRFGRIMAGFAAIVLSTQMLGATEGTATEEKTIIPIKFSQNKEEMKLPNGHIYVTKDFETYTRKSHRIKTEDGITFTDAEGNIYQDIVLEEPEQEGLTEWGTTIEVIGVNGLMHFDLDQIPFIKDTRTLVPLKQVVEAFGARAEISPQDSTITVKADDKTLVFRIDSKVYTVNGVEQEMDTVPYIANNRVYLPVRYAFEVFDQEVLWNNKSASVYADIEVTNLADYRNIYYRTSIGDVSCRNVYPSGLNVIPGELNEDLEGTVIEFYVPYMNNEQAIKDLKYVLSGLDLQGFDQMTEKLYTITKPLETLQVENTTYTLLANGTNGVYVKVSDRRATGEKFPIYVVEDEEVHEDLSVTAYKHYANSYIEIVEGCEVAGINLTSDLYANELIFSDGTMINICEGYYKQDGEMETLNGTIFVKDNMLYMDMDAFNEVFGTDFTWERNHDK